jgi:prepilin-type N-terminal cleavage/methylation domain-containing protein
MKRGERPAGYTIIEVMIVLAVSGLMFVIAASFINGKQAKTAFTAGVNEMASRMQDTIEQVVNGKYSDVLLTCSGTPPSFFNIQIGSSTGQGTNPDCVFLGKILHFTQDSSTYEIFSTAGFRLDNNGEPATSLGSSGIAEVDPLTTQESIPQNLTVSKMTPKYGIGYIQSQGTLATGGLKNGSQNVSLYQVTSINSNMTNAGSQINSSTVVPTNNATICLTDGTRYAEIVLGSNGNQLNVDVKFDGTTKPAGVC